MLVRVCSTVIHPQEVEFASKSNDGSVYTVITSSILNDPICSCRGYLFRGTCSHILEVESQKCDWYRSPASDYQDLIECPNCGAPLEDFETRSEFV